MRVLFPAEYIRHFTDNYILRNRNSPSCDSMATRRRQMLFMSRPIPFRGNFPTEADLLL